MKKFVTLRFTLIALGVLTVSAWFIPFEAIAEKAMEYLGNDPDMPRFLEQASANMSKEEFMARRAEQIALYRDMKDGDIAEKINTRNKAIARMEEQQDVLRSRPASPQNNALLAAWTPIGPDPIPN